MRVYSLSLTPRTPRCSLTAVGNHDITLDAAFYEEHGSSWRWPQPQDAEQCRKLLQDSPSITYLENQAASIYLSSEEGPHTCFKVFGSPCTPKKWNWAFQYEADEASKLWDAIPSDCDVVVTHTPPKNHCDVARKDDRTGCEALLNALRRVRPMLSVFGHIHEARGAERVRWNAGNAANGCAEESTEVWKDPGVGNNKQSLVDVTAKGGRPLDNYSALTRIPAFSAQRAGGQAGGLDDLQPDAPKSTSRLEGVVNSEAIGKAMLGGAIAYCQGRVQGDIGLVPEPDVETVERRYGRRETVMINAAFVGPRSSGPKTFNKPIVVDIDLPVWRLEQDAE